MLIGRPFHCGARVARAVERVHQAVGEVDGRALRHAAAVHLGGPARRLDLSHQRSRLPERRGPAGEAQRLRAVGTRQRRRRDPPVAAARRRVGSETTVGAGELEDRPSGVLQALAEESRRDSQGLRGLGPAEVHDLPEDVGQPMGPVQALEHRRRARHLDLFDEDRVLRVVRGRGLQAHREVLREPLEAEVQTFDRALLRVEDGVHRHPVRPRLETAAEVELRESGNDADQDLLRRILRVLAVPQHPQGKAVDVALERPHQALQSLTVAVDRPPGDVFEARGRRHPLFHPASLAGPPGGCRPF